MRIRKERLAAKGWHPDEIEKTMHILEQAEQRKNDFTKFTEGFLPWLALAVALVGNFIVSYALVPLMVLINNLNIYFIILIIAGSFGVLFTSVVKDIDLHIHHDLLLLMIIPLVAFVNFFIITTIANSLSKAYMLDSSHLPAGVGLVYALAFLAPYAHFLIHKGLLRRRQPIPA